MLDGSRLQRPPPWSLGPVGHGSTAQPMAVAGLGGGLLTRGGREAKQGEAGPGPLSVPSRCPRTSSSSTSKSATDRRPSPRGTSGRRRAPSRLQACSCCFHSGVRPCALNSRSRCSPTQEGRPFTRLLATARGAAQVGGHQAGVRGGSSWQLCLTIPCLV